MKNARVTKTRVKMGRRVTGTRTRSLTGDMRLRKKVGIDLKKRARDFKHLERERERESSSLS